MKRLMIVLVVLLFAAAMLGCGKDKGKDKGKIADKQAPSVPNGIGITAVSSSEIKISWNPSTDDSGKVKGYKIYRNNEHIKTVETASVSDAGLSPQVKFCYRISAFDEAGNESAHTGDVCAIL